MLVYEMLLIMYLELWHVWYDQQVQPPVWTIHLASLLCLGGIQSGTLHLQGHLAPHANGLQEAPAADSTPISLLGAFCDHSINVGGGRWGGGWGPSAQVVSHTCDVQLSCVTWGHTQLKLSTHIHQHVLLSLITNRFCCLFFTAT